MSETSATGRFKSRASLAGGACVLLGAVAWLTAGSFREEPDPGPGREPNTEGLSSGRSAAENERLSSAKRRSQERSEPDGITVTEAERLLAEARQNPDSIRRTLDSIKVIADLCRAGHTEEAWALIEANPGQVRDSQLVKFFLSANLTVPEMISKIESLPFEGEATEALGGYLSSLELADTSRVLADPAFQELIKRLGANSKDPLGGALTASLMRRLGSPGASSKDMPAARELASRLLSEGKLTNEQFAQIFKADNTADNFEKWSLIESSLKAGKQNPSAAQLRRDVIEGMVNANAPKAMGMLTKKSDSQGIVDLTVGIEKWGRVDPVQAAEWYESQRGSLTPVQGDGMALAFYRLSLSAGDTESAKRWAAEISNKELRQRALGKVTKDGH
jgi:hypothetical protein